MSPDALLGPTQLSVAVGPNEARPLPTAGFNFDRAIVDVVLIQFNCSRHAAILSYDNG
jgi:hypothetical protein